MDLGAEKKKIIEWVKGLDDPDIIHGLIAMSMSDKNWWDKISQEERDGILRGHQDYLAGRTIPHEEVIEKNKQQLDEEE